MKIVLEDGTKITAQQLWESNLKSNPLYLKLLNQNKNESPDNQISQQIE